MSVVVEVGHPQKDGRRYVIERFSDAEGEFVSFTYLAPVGADHNAIALAREPEILSAAAEAEVDTSLGTDTVPPTFRFQTRQEFLLRVREMFRTARGERAAHIARWIRNRVQEGSLTQAQLRSAFGLDQQQWDAVLTRMQTLVAHLEALEAAQGE